MPCKYGHLSWQLNPTYPCSHVLSSLQLVVVGSQVHEPDALQVPWPEHGLPAPPGQSCEQSAPRNPGLHTHAPSMEQMPLPEHSALVGTPGHAMPQSLLPSGCDALMERYPTSHTHLPTPLPSIAQVPCPEHPLLQRAVQLGPIAPCTQRQRPEALSHSPNGELHGARLPAGLPWNIAVSTIGHCELATGCPCAITSMATPRRVRHRILPKTEPRTRAGKQLTRTKTE